MNIIPEDNYKQIIELLPILCVDIMVKNRKGKYLLIQRAREPLKGFWWVIGGRVMKGETLEEGAIRKIREETGIVVDKVTMEGYYEDTRETSPFGSPIPIHSVSVVFSANYPEGQEIKLDYQSSAWKFSDTLPEKFNIRF